jgi:hypothetical protein
MLARHAVLLTPSESALPSCLLFYKQIASISPLESSLTGRSQIIENPATLSLADSAVTRLPPASSLESALTKNKGGGGAILPILELLKRRSPLSYSMGVWVRSVRPTFRHWNIQAFRRFSDLSPFLSYSYELFCTHKNHNPFIFKRFRTLCAKHPGVGGPQRKMAP